MSRLSAWWRSVAPDVDVARRAPLDGLAEEVARLRRDLDAVVAQAEAFIRGLDAQLGPPRFGDAWVPAAPAGVPTALQPPAAFWGLPGLPAVAPPPAAMAPPPAAMAPPPAAVAPVQPAVAPARPAMAPAQPAFQAPAPAPAQPAFQAPALAPAVPRPAGAAPVSLAGPGRGFPEAGPWLTYYGTAADAGDLDAIAAKHRVINIDADPGVGNFDKEQIARLKAGGRNRVLSYLNLGAVESFRDYWRSAPPGLTPAGRNQDAMLGPYDGYPDETWMDPANPAWRKLVLDHIIPRLVAQGVDGFYLDNLELLSHGPGDRNGPISAASRQAGLDLVREIRERYPNMLIVQQNGLGAATLNGTTGGRPYAELLDGVSHEEVFTTMGDGDRYRAGTDDEALAAMRAWRDRGLRPGGRPLLLATQEYVNDLGNHAGAQQADRRGRAEGFTVFVGDKSAGLQRVPRWTP